MSVSAGSRLNPHAHIEALPPSWLDRICRDEDAWLACVSVLQDFSFIRQHEREDSISLHPLIHEWSIHFCELSWMNDNLAAAANILGAALLATESNRVGTAASSLRSHIDHWYAIPCIQRSRPSSEFGADTGATFEIAHFYRRQGFFERYRVLSDGILNNFITRLGPTHRKTLELRIDMWAVLLEESRWEEATQALPSVQDEVLKLRWFPSLTLKENNAFVLSSLIWHLPTACCEVGKMEPLRQLLKDIENLQDDREVSRMRSCLIFARLWLENKINPFQEKDDQAAAYNRTLIEAEIDYLGILNDAALWPSIPGRQIRMNKSQILHLLGEQYFEQGELAKAKASLLESLKIFKEIDGLQGRTTLVCDLSQCHTWLSPCFSFREL